MTDEPQDKDDNMKTSWPFLVLCLSLLFIGIVTMFFPDVVARHREGLTFPTDLSGLGDMYGVLNTLFSGLAFALLIYTAMMQRAELEMQRRELAQTRDIFEQQKSIQSQQYDLLRKESDRREDLFNRETNPRLLMILDRFHSGIHTNYLVFKIYNSGGFLYEFKIHPVSISCLRARDSKMKPVFESNHDVSFNYKILCLDSVKNLESVSVDVSFYDKFGQRWMGDCAVKVIDKKWIKKPSDPTEYEQESTCNLRLAGSDANHPDGDQGKA